jgi:hypothetical protein
MKALALCLLLFLASCVDQDFKKMNLDELEIKIYQDWFYASNIDGLNVDDKVITRPPGIEALLFRIVMPTDGGISVKTHCVYYKVPYKNILGELKIIEQKNEGKCETVSVEKSLYEISGLSEFRINLKQFKLELYFKYKNNLKSWKFNLPNISNGFQHQKYQASKDIRLYPGLIFLKTSEKSFDQVNSKYLGKLNDRMSTGDVIRCQQVNKMCQTIGENRCDSCRYGWYAVVDYNCPQGGTKFCGQNHCGEKNEPACPRGIKTVSDLESGICQNDLTAVFSADHILICQ